MSKTRMSPVGPARADSRVFAVLNVSAARRTHFVCSLRCTSWWLQTSAAVPSPLCKRPLGMLHNDGNNAASNVVLHENHDPPLLQHVKNGSEESPGYFYSSVVMLVKMSGENHGSCY